MDVVQRNIDALRGKVEIDSKLGAGSTITIRLPLTLAIINGFGVQVADETFIIPMEFVEECMEMPNGLPKGNAEGVINLRGDALPFVRLRSIFDIHGGSTDRENVVVMQHENGCTGLAVDHLLGECQAIIKPLNRLFQNVAGVSGSTVLGDGRVALILDVNALIGHAHLQHQEKR
jgi:two-component system chemotaxis sensor kinase CheA